MPLNDFGGVGDDYQRYSDGIRGRIRHELVFEVVAGLTTAGGTVLDMGCGDGEISVRLCEAGFNVLGVDASPEKCCVEQMCVRPNCPSEPVSGLILRSALSKVSRQDRRLMQSVVMGC